MGPHFFSDSIDILAHELRGASFNCELRYLRNLVKNLKKSALLKNNIKKFELY